MEKFYDALHLNNESRGKQFISFERNLDSRAYALATLMLLAFLLHPATNATAQQQSFFENFDGAEIEGIPEGWSVWQNGGGAAPLFIWRAWKYWPLGADKYVLSDIEPGREGVADEDWLITPKITPQAGDHLIFETRRNEFETGDMYYIRISTTTNKPEDFTNTLIAFTEADLPVNMNKVSVDISAYANTPIHIAFVHWANVGPDAESNLWVLDNVSVRPIQQAYVADAYFRQATSPPQPPIVLGDDVIFAGTLQFALNGDYGVAKVSSITLTLGNTTDPSLVKKIMVYYTPFEGVTDQDILEGNLPLFGSIDNPTGTFEITGEIDLELGTAPWFYFRYILDETRQLTYPYPQVDATVEKYVVNGHESIPSVKTYLGAIDVVSPGIYNDHFADAAELVQGITRYGSSTVPATYQPEFDSIIYCHNEGNRFVHSVWWYFVPQADGWMSVDLSESRFNSLLAFLDEDFNQLACNDNISETKSQSKISDMPVTKGKKIYVRVSDTGYDPSNPYGNAGVVVLDFNFSTPLGTEETNMALSAPYPNPTTGKATVEVAVKVPGDVIFEVRDAMGRSLLIQKETFFNAGKHPVVLDVSSLRSGSYIIHAQGHNIDNACKLILTR